MIIDRRDSVTGQRRRVTVGTFDTKKAAQKAERRALEQRDGGMFVEPDTLTVAELLERWLAVKADDVRPQTLRNYELFITKHILPTLGAVPVQRLTTIQVQDAYMAWRAAGVAAHRVRACHTVLNQAMAFAVRMRLLAHNPCTDAEPPSYRPKEKAVWTREQLADFLGVAGDDDLSPLWHVLALTGMRIGEVLGLRWVDIDLERAVVTVRQTAIRRHQGVTAIQPETKTRAGRRSIKLPEIVVEMLRDHRVRWLERKLAAGTWGDADLVFCTATGAAIHADKIRYRFASLCRAANVPNITVHGVRHTHATHLLAAGVPVKVVSGRLGHATGAITMDLYGHLLSDMQDGAAAVMDALLREA